MQTSSLQAQAAKRAGKTDSTTDNNWMASQARSTAIFAVTGRELTCSHEGDSVQICTKGEEARDRGAR
jgi:hypothetical protein